MKKFTLVVFAVILGTVALNATNPKEMNFKEKLRIEIEKILEGSKFLTNQAEVTAKVEFVLNKKGEIVVLDVESVNEKLGSFLKDKLNYKLLLPLTKDVNSSKRFSIPVKVIRE